MESNSNGGIFGFLALKAACCMVLFLALTGSLSGLGLLASGANLLYLGPLGLILVAGIAYGLLRRHRRKTEKTPIAGMADRRPDDPAGTTARLT